MTVSWEAWSDELSHPSHSPWKSPTAVIPTLRTAPTAADISTLQTSGQFNFAAASRGLGPEVFLQLRADFLLQITLTDLSTLLRAL